MSTWPVSSPWTRFLGGRLFRGLRAPGSPPAETDAASVRASEARLRSALRSGRTVAWEWDLVTDRIIRSENSPELLGLPVQSVARGGGEFAALVHPDDREHVTTAVRRALETRQAVETTFRLLRPDGSIMWVVDEGTFEVDATGKPVRMSGIIRDVTEWKREELARRESERALAELRDQLAADLATVVRLHEISTRFVQEGNLTTLLEDVLAAVMTITGTDGGTIQLLDQASGTLRLVVERGLGPDFARFFAGVAVGSAACGTAMAQGGRVIVEDVRTSPLYDDQTRAAMVAARALACQSTPLYSRSGEILGMISTHFRAPHRPSDRELRLVDLFARQAADFVEHRRAQTARETLLARELEARAEAEAANQAKDQFLAMLSHELRTPLNAMLGWVRMLRGGRLDAAGAAHGLEVIERNVRQQTQIIADLLDVSRIVSGKLTVEMGPVELAPTIEIVLDTFRPTAHAKGIELVGVLDPATGSVTGDAARLEQVMSNLVSNALKFTPAGGRVTVTLERAGDRARMTVSDTGCGIGADFLPFLFERFRQADSTTTRVHGGLGLGLAIVRHLVEVHRGWVRAESHGEGQGATFTVELPLRMTDAAVAWVAVPSRWNGTEATLAGTRVLLVDDDADSLELMKVILEQHGATVDTVRSVDEALRGLDRVVPDVLVSDISMPGEDGFDLMRRVRAMEGPAQGTPAIAVSAYARPEDAARAVAAGFRRHLAKPVDPRELVRAIDAVRGGRRSWSPR
jgi:PAS domain S-box-containing protein